MSEFNTGKPPSGEAGMCVLLTDERARREYFRRWDGKTFYCGRYRDYPDSARLAFRDPIAIGLNVVDWRWATLADLTAAGIPESEARGMVHKSMLPDAPWYPPQQEGFGPWVEHDGAGLPVDPGTVVLVLWPMEREARRYAPEPACEAKWRHWGEGCAMVAYCVKLGAKPAIAATCAPPDTPPQEAPEDEAAMNAAMIERDLREPAERPQAVAVAVAEPTPWHLRCAPWTNRFGGWGA